MAGPAPSPNAAGAAGRRWAWAGLAIVLCTALGLRLWGIGEGLPYVYNLDESSHFVPRAVAMFGRGLNPHYFANPPALTYLLHVLFAVWFGGHAGVSHAYARHPTEVYILARVASAALGTAAVWLLYILGSRLFGRAVGLLAAAIEAVAFLPVFYAHLALNDAPALAPLTLSLIGSVGVLKSARRVDYLLAGVGLGVACATKYTAGIAAVALLAAIACRHLGSSRQSPPARAGRSAPLAAPLGVAIAALAAVGGFLLANPFALLDFQHFHSELARQSALSGEVEGKLGAPNQGGLSYYLWSLSWGLGWLPALAALAGAIRLLIDDRLRAWLLVPAPVLFLAFMSLQARHFGRWVMPILPILCVLAAYLAVRLAAPLASRSPRLRAPAIVLAGVLLCGQGLLYSIHSALVLSRPDTRSIARAWMLANVPSGSRIVVEPVVPNAWLSDVTRGALDGPVRARWEKYPALQSLAPSEGGRQGAPHTVRPEEYELTLSPALLDYYRRNRYCWVLSGSTQSGRAQADPGELPGAIAYYRALAAQASVVLRVSPYGRGQAPVKFGFDWSFDYYPLAYRRPGPEITVYRLHGGGCAPQA